jgi:hypothetical protein
MDGGGETTSSKPLGPIKLFQGFFFRSLKDDDGILKVSSGLIHWVELMNPHPRFLVQGHIY